MSEDNKKISEEKKQDYIDSFEYVKVFRSEGKCPREIEYLMSCMCFCYTYFRSKNLITQVDVGYYGNRKQSAINITFLGHWWQYIKDWFHNKFNKVQIDLNWTEVIKRRQLSNLKDECNKFIMPRLEEVRKDLDKNSE